MPHSTHPTLCSTSAGPARAASPAARVDPLGAGARYSAGIPPPPPARGEIRAWSSGTRVRWAGETSPALPRGSLETPSVWRGTAPLSPRRLPAPLPGRVPMPACTEEPSQSYPPGHATLRLRASKLCRDLGALRGLGGSRSPWGGKAARWWEAVGRRGGARWVPLADPLQSSCWHLSPGLINAEAMNLPWEPGSRPWPLQG